MAHDQLYVGGRWVAARAEPVPVLSPHTGDPIAAAATATAADIDDAVSAAQLAFDQGPWPRLALADRIEVASGWASPTSMLL